MSDSRWRGNSGATGQIESIIRAARWFVRPSEELRPRIVEAARKRIRERRVERTLGGFVVLILVGVTVGSPAFQYANVLRTRTSTPSASDMQDRATEYAAQREIGTHWGMAEAFSQMKRVQATQMGRPEQPPAVHSD